MVRFVLLLTLLLSSGAATAGDWIFRPTVKGSFAISQQGGGAEMGPATVSQNQRAGEMLTVTLVPGGRGRCEGDVLTGSDSLSFIKLSLSQVFRVAGPGTEQVACGQSARFEVAASDRLVGVTAAVKAFSPQALNGLPAGVMGSRVLLGNLNFASSTGTATSTAIYLDMTTLRAGTDTLKASFNKALVSFGLVSNLSDATGTVNLTVGKTRVAEAGEIEYQLKFESTQASANSFQMRDALGVISVPYSVNIGDRLMTPMDIYTGVLPAGTGTSNILTINVLLAAKQINGLPAKTMLRDTLTAVISPGS